MVDRKEKSIFSELSVGDLISSGLVILLISGIAYVIGSNYEKGFLSSFGIESLKPIVAADTYIEILSKLGILMIVLFFFSSIKEKMSSYFSREMTKKEKIKFTIFACVSILALPFIYWLPYYFIDGRSFERSTSDVWNNYLAYVFLIAVVAFCFFLAYKYFKDLLRARQNSAIHEKIKILHYVIEGAAIFFLLAACLSSIGALAQHLGRQSAKTLRSYPVAQYENNDRYVIIQDDKNVLVGVAMCSKDSWQLKKGTYKYLENTKIISIKSEKYKIDENSFCT